MAPTVSCIFFGFLALQLTKLSEGFVVHNTCQCGKQTTFHSRIVNGRKAEMGAYPWQAAIYQNPNTFYCGGSVITDYHILTAGHCFHGVEDFDGWYVMLGIIDIRRFKGDRYGVASWVLHPHYHLRHTASVNDIAIVKVDRKIIFTPSIQPVCLINTDRFGLTGLVAITTGWGSMRFEGKGPHSLYEGAVIIYSHNDCKKSLVGVHYYKEAMLCASSYPVDSCSGDSGGPLVIDVDSEYMMQVGIVSFGYKCGEPNSAGMYTRVATFHNWINNVTADAISCQVPGY